MKQEKTGKNKRVLLLISVLAALLVIAGVVLAILLLPGQQATPAGNPERAELYWNIDRVLYTENSPTGLSTREPDADGLYHVRVAIDGTQKELIVADKKVINYMDNLEVFGIVTDADGIVVEAVPAKNLATEKAIGYFVRRAEGDTVVVNSSKTMNGIEETLTMAALTGVYDVAPDAEVIGQPGQCAPLDKVHVYSNDNGVITHVFIAEHAQTADVYYRVGYHYEWYEKHTTRVPDENGVYTMTFAKGGKHVELKCKDYDLVNQIDSFDNGEADFAFLFDEEGYIVKIVDTAMALTGMEGCYGFDVTSLENGTFTATASFAHKSNFGKTFTGTLDENCEIYLVDGGGFAKMIGEPTALQPRDRIICYTDLEGKPILIFVTKRMADSPMYYNISRSYANGQTTRTPDEKGYYVFNMAVGGKQVELKTKDKAIASRVDSFSNQCMGLKLNGKIIEEVYDAANVCGWGMIGQGRYVTALAGGLATITSGSNFDTYNNVIISDNCEIYDVTWNNVTMGSKTDLRLYDQVTSFRSPGGEITHMYVTQRYIEDSKIYYNIERKYADGATTRLTDEEGYYVYDMICEGKAVTLKTKDKDIANFIDKQWPNFTALQVKNGIIKQAYKAASAIKYGGSVSPYHYVGEINKEDRTFSTYYYEGGQRKEGYGLKTMAENCVIYNVSAGYSEYRGEKATLKPDDIIQGFKVNPGGEVVQIYILSREFDSPLYWNTKQMFNWTDRVTTRQPNADGYYVFDLIANGKPVQVKTKDKDIATAIDAKETGFSLMLNGDEVVRVGTPALAKGIKEAAATFTDVTAISGNKLTVTQVRLNRDNVGEVKELTLAKNYKVYDMSSYANPRGAETTLGLGDRVTCYTNIDNEVVACFITYKNTRQEGHISLCEHCGEEVYWHPYPGTFYAQDAHYYLTHDYYATSQRSIGNTETQYDVVLDLNGHTLTAKKRAFLIYGTLNIMDTVGGGTIAAENGDGSFGGCIMATASGTLNLYSGTLTQAKDATYGRLGGVLNFSGYNTVFNMYGGTVCGGTVAQNDGGTPYGGNIYVSGGTVNIYGGKITGGKIISDSTTASRGCNIYITGKLNLMGGTIDGDIAVIGKNTTVTLSGAPVVNKGSVAGLYFKSKLLKLENLKENASVVITTSGAFAEDAEEMRSCFKTTKSGDTITVQDGDLVYAAGKINVNNSDLSFRSGTTRAMCPVCGEEVTWIALTQENFSTTVLQMASHYYLPDDITSDSTTAPVINVPTWKKAGGEQNDGFPICIHLNGHNITANNYYAISNNYGGATLNVMGNGIVSGNNPTANRASTVFMNTENTLAMNLYGGTYVKPDTNANAIAQVGIWNTQSTLNISGDATFDCLHDSDGDGEGDIYGSSLSVQKGTVNISDGKFTGETTVISGGVLTLSGTPEIGLLKIPADAKVQLGELKTGASITVIATGVFTEENEKADDYVDFFHPAITTDQIVPEGNALKYVGTPGDDTVDNSDLAFLSGTKRAVCPVCDTLVEWVALNQDNYASFRDGGESTGHMKAGVHYYLAESITTSGVAVKIPTWTQAGGAATDGLSICLHLNGNDITSTSTYAIQNNYGGATLNVMGNGTVSGNNTTANRASTILIVADNTKALNLYGGTYVKPAENTNPVVGMGVWSTVKSTVNIFTGATIEGGINLYDGGNLTLTDTNINGEVNVKAGNVTLVGGTTIDLLTLADGVKITLQDLTNEASVTISASGVFTQPNEHTEDYFGRFTSASSIAKVALSEDKTQLLMQKDYSQDLRFNEGTTTAFCPVCDKEVQWVGLNQSNYASYRDGAAATGYLLAGNHYYLEESLEAAGIIIKVPTYKNAGGAASDGKAICLHLNGKNITSTGDYAISNNYGGATLNMMGSGIVSGNKTTTDRATTIFHCTDNNRAINLYGGTYVKPDTNTSANPIISVGIWETKNVLNIHGDTIIDGTGDTKGGCIVLHKGTINMTGGTIKNGTASHGGNVRIVTGTFNMQGGTIEDGTATDTWGLGGNVQISGTAGAADKSVFNMTAGTISGGAAVYGGNINAKNATVTLAGTVTGGQVLTNASVSKAFGGNVHVQAGAIVTITGTLTEGQATNGGNLRVQDGTVTLQGATLNNGTATVGKNIYMDAGSLTIEDSNITGAVGIYGGNVTLCGSTQIKGDTRWGNMYLDSDVKLTVKADFTGLATVAIAGVTDTIPAANGVSEGPFTGTLTLEVDGDPAIIGQGTGLVIQTA